MNIYEPRDEERVSAAIEQVLRNNIENPALDDTDVLGALTTSVAQTIAEQQEQALKDIANAAFLETATGEALTLKAKELGVERREAVAATGVLKFSRSTDATTDFVIPNGTAAQTRGGDVTFTTTESVTINQGTQTALASARATDGGADTNLPPNRLIDLPSPPSGIENVTNPEPTGDDDLTDTNGNQLIPGLSRETDRQLRARTFQSTSIGGAATVGAINTAVLDLDGVRSVSVFTNKTNSTDGRGLDAFSSEVIVSGGNDTEIAETLRDTVSVTELFRLQNGVIGNPAGTDVLVPAADQTVTVGFSRPTELSINIDMTIETTRNYIGDKSIKNRIVEYVGGTRTDGSTVTGTGTGEDVSIDQVETAIVDRSPQTGVVGIANLVLDTTGDGTDDRTTDANGLSIIQISQAEQATVDASNITITQV